MIAENSQIFAVLRQFNPWWDGGEIPELPKWQRAVFLQLWEWLTSPPAKRAILLSGARQVGKTTLLLQAIQKLLRHGVDPNQILYVTFDHPLLKLVGLEQVLQVWKEFQPAKNDTEYLILDEIQYNDDWATWIKHQIDFPKNQKIAVTGSAMPLNRDNQESGVGRWHTIQLPTLSFFEYLQIKEISFPYLPQIPSLLSLFGWSPEKFIKLGETSRPLISHFHDYILRGGFPQTALVEPLSIAQKLMREDIVDKVLKRDMSALYGVRGVLDLERIFLYLCLHDSGILNITAICSNLGKNRSLVNSYIDLLESAHLIYKLYPIGYGKEVLRARYKVYLADAAISGSVLLKGKSLLDDSTLLGRAVETAFFKHVFSRYYQVGIGFSYWRGKNNQEVDIIAEVEGRLIPFEVKYSQSKITHNDIKGLKIFCEEKNVANAYVVTRDSNDFGLISFKNPRSETRVLKIPAHLACFWLSQSEISSTSSEISQTD